MFHYDLTQEDTRIIATEHRVPLTGDDLEYAARHNAVSKDLGAPQMPSDKHDGTFDVLHIIGPTGRTHTINLTSEELALVIYLAMVGDEGKLSEFAWETKEVKRYQELMKDHQELSFIP